MKKEKQMLLDAMYVCSSPYQIMTAVILATNNCEKADIYINGFFKQFDKYVEMLRLSGVFRNVFVIPYDVYTKYFNKEGRLAPKLQAFRNYLFPDKIAESIIPSDCFYKKIYSPNRDIICRYIQFYHFRHNNDSELCLYEEGNSLYTDYIFPDSIIEKGISRILYGKKALIPHSLFLYSPELFSMLEKHAPSMIVKKIDVTKKATEETKRLFSYYGNLHKNSAILIDTHKSSIFTENENNSLEKLYRTIIEGLETTVYLKKHPREMDVSFEIDKIIDDSLPFEVLCTDSNADGFVLISYISTAVATPKLMFNKEPYVVLLYKLVHSNLDISVLDKYYRAFKQLYSCPERVFIPDTIEELMNNISFINSKLDQ